jgi:flagellar hook-length control protein FliK
MMIPLKILSSASESLPVPSGNERPQINSRDSVEKKGFLEFLKDAANDRERASDAESRKKIGEGETDQSAEKRERIDEPDKRSREKATEQTERRRESRDEHQSRAREEKERRPSGEMERHTPNGEKTESLFSVLNALHTPGENPVKVRFVKREKGPDLSAQSGTGNPLLKKGFSDEILGASVRRSNIFQQVQKSPKKIEKPVSGTMEREEKKERVSGKRSEIGAGPVMVPVDPEKWRVHGRVKSDHAAENRSGEIEAKESAPRRLSFEDRKGDTKQGDRDSQGGQNSAFARSEIRASAQPPVESQRAEIRSQFAELVEKAHVNITPEGNSFASIRLNPESLGRLTMNLRVVNNSVEANLVVESDQVRKMILNEIESLRNELKGHGIQVESFSVRVRESFLSFDQSNDQSSGGDMERQSGSGFNSRSGEFARNRDETEEFSSFFAHNYPEKFDDMEYETVGRPVRLEYDGALNVRL